MPIVIIVDEIWTKVSFQDLLDAFQKKDVQKFTSILPWFPGAIDKKVEAEQDLEIVYYQVLLGGFRSKMIFENEEISKVRRTHFHSLFIKVNFHKF